MPAGTPAAPRFSGRALNIFQHSPTARRSSGRPDNQAAPLTFFSIPSSRKDHGTGQSLKPAGVTLFYGLLILLIFSARPSALNALPVRPPVHSEHASRHQRPIAHPPHSTATTPQAKALSQAPGVVPSAFGSRCLSLAFPYSSPLPQILPHERERLAGKRAHEQ